MKNLSNTSLLMIALPIFVSGCIGMAEWQGVNNGHGYANESPDRALRECEWEVEKLPKAAVVIEAPYETTHRRHPERPRPVQPPRPTLHGDNPVDKCMRAKGFDQRIVPLR